MDHSFTGVQNGFLVFVFFCLEKNQNPRNVEFFGFMFFGYFCRINFTLKPYTVIIFLL